MADAYARRAVPTYMQISGGQNGGPDSDFQKFMQTMSMKSMQDLSLNMKTK